MDFNFDNERPIYVQLVEKIRLAIVSGVYQANSKIPSVRELALTFKVNPNTIQKALSELENENLIYTERTNGKFVTSNKKLIEKVKRNIALENANKYLAEMNKIGISFNDCVKYLQEIGDSQ